MNISPSALETSINKVLCASEFRDYCPNGLQVEGRPEIRRLVTGVTACQALIDAAVEADADAILVHHGYFWQGENPVLRGIRKNRVKTLLSHDISLFAYHLPLDDHPKLGNNAQLGNLLGFTTKGQMQPGLRSKVGVWGHVDEPVSGADLASRITSLLNHEVLHIPGSAEPISTIAWCTGGAQNAIEHALSCGAQAYLTGEVSEQTVHFARETGLHFFAAGHHATERYGVLALGEWLAVEHGIEHINIDIDNPA